LANHLQHIEIMQTEELIKSLSQNLPPMPAQALQRNLLQGIALGALATLVIFVIGYGTRADLATAIKDASTLMKLTYGMSMALFAWVLCEKLARPGVNLKHLVWMPLLPVLLLASIAVVATVKAPPELRHTMLYGHSSLYCPFNIALLSLPVFAMLIRSLRRAAPTQLRLTASVAGLLSGGIATLFYSLYCNENTVQFVTAWYTAGMLLPAAYGFVFGHKLLRWS
jgi:hypothetical protein